MDNPTITFSHRYATRSKGLTQHDERESTRPQLIPVLDPVRGSALVAGSAESQEAFLKAVGIVSTY